MSTKLETLAKELKDALDASGMITVEPALFMMVDDDEMDSLRQAYPQFVAHNGDIRALLYGVAITISEEESA